MAWQDIVITVTIILFAYALVPQVIKGFKRKKQDVVLQTSIITSLGMYVLTFTYLTLGLKFSTITAGLTGTLWAVIAIQRMVYR
jgi:hypothetical protein